MSNRDTDSDGGMIHVSTRTNEDRYSRHPGHPFNAPDDFNINVNELRRGTGSTSSNEWMGSDNFEEPHREKGEQDYDRNGYDDGGVQPATQGETHDIEKQTSRKSNKSEARESLAQALKDAGPPPDGGALAWMQVVGGFLAFFNSWGIVNAFGEYQNYYQQNLLSKESPSTISWIGSVEAFMVIGVPVITGRFIDGGHMRKVLILGWFMLVFGLMMTSLSSEFYQVFLAQGVCAGIGSATMFSSAIATVAPYFKRRRASAIGLMASGSSLGGVIYPIMVQQLIPKLGFPWTTRVIAFMVLGTSIVPVLVLRSRLPPRKSGPLIDIASLRDWPFMVFSFGCVFCFAGLYVPIFYVEAYAQQSPNVSKTISTYVLAILNSASVFGRLLPNFAADKTGPMNMLIPTVAGASILTFCWIAIDNSAGLAVFAGLYGFMSGSMVSIPGSVVSNLTDDMTKIGTRMGMNFGLSSIGVLLGGPVAGAIINNNGGDYTRAQIFGGVMVMIGAFFVTASRLMFTRGKLWAKA